MIMNEWLIRYLREHHGMDARGMSEQEIRDALPSDAPLYRSAAIRAETADDDTLSVDIVLATDEPVQMWDWDMWATVDEVLPMAGCDIAGIRRGKLPLVDNHQYDTSRRVLGSISDLKTTDHELLGREYYSSINKDDYTRTKEGHTDQRSVGYHVKSATYIEPGETETVEGIEYTAGSRKLKVATAWRPIEGSVVVIGADANAGARAKQTRAQQSNRKQTRAQKGIAMNPKLRKLLVELGMPEDASDEQAMEYLQREETQAAIAERSANPPPPDGDGDQDGHESDAPSAPSGVDVVEQIRSERKRVEDIEAAAERMATIDGVEAIARRARVEGLTVGQFRAEVAVHLETNQPRITPGVEVTADASDKTRSAIGAAIMVRQPRWCPTPTDEERKMAREFRGMSLLEMARYTLEQAGTNTRGLSRAELAKRALSHSTGDFPYILSTSANKSLQHGYGSVPSTFQRWCAIGQLSNFKTSDIVKDSDFTTLDKTPAGGTIKQATMSEDREQMNLVKYAKIFSIDVETLINDDMDVFTQTPAKFGRAWKRTQSQEAVGQLIGTDEMTDGEAFFSASHAVSNLTTGATYLPDSVEDVKSVVGQGIITMLGYTDLAGNTMGVTPRFVLHGATYWDMFRDAFRRDNKVAKDEEPGIGDLDIENITEVQFDNSNITGYSTKMTILLADPADIAAVWVKYLDGDDAPMLDEDESFTNWGRRYRVIGVAGFGHGDFRAGHKFTGEAA